MKEPHKKQGGMVGDEEWEWERNACLQSVI